jgi:hypothetical protein
MTADLTEQLLDVRWRLANLYKCREEGTGRAMPFIPREEQRVIFRHLIETPTVPAYIIKSRRLGLSTGICIFQSDAAAFSRGWRGLLIDQTQYDATKKMEEIIRFSVDSLPPELLCNFEFPKRNDTQLRMRTKGETDSEDSVIYATTSGRGGDCSMLHVSEWGPIAAMDAKRSAEIRSGSFPAARNARRVVETTWMGGKAGDLWAMIEPIMLNDPNAEGVVYFFPWHADPQAVKFDGTVTGEAQSYFMDLAAKLGKSFSEEQKKWWCAKKIEQGLFMAREYPSTLEEAFRAPIEGAVYARFIEEAFTAGRVRPLMHDPAELVWTFWDIGSPLNTRVVYVQFIGNSIHILDHDDGLLEMSTAVRVAHMLGKGYSYGAHFLPHDAESRGATGINFREAITRAGLPGCRVLPRCMSEWPGVNKVAEIIPRCVFNEDTTRKLLSSLSYYHTRKDRADGHFTDILVDDWSAHDADAFRMLAEALMNNMLAGHASVVRDLRTKDQRQRKASAGRWKP